MHDFRPVPVLLLHGMASEYSDHSRSGADSLRTQEVKRRRLGHMQLSVAVLNAPATTPEPAEILISWRLHIMLAARHECCSSIFPRKGDRGLRTL